MAKKSFGNVLKNAPPAAVETTTEQVVKPEIIPETTPVAVEEKTAKRRITPAKTKQTKPKAEEPMVMQTLQLNVPKSVKKQMRDRIHDDDTGQTSFQSLVLQGLKAIGIDVPEEVMLDRRKLVGENRKPKKA